MFKLNPIKLFSILILATLVICHDQPQLHPFVVQQNSTFKLLNPLGERNHIMEHLEFPQNTSNMTEEEVQFHYFKIWDLDHNNKLDGCELINVVIHWEGGGFAHDNSTGSDQIKILNDEELSNLVDPILDDHDEDQDGMIAYYEYMRSLTT